MLAPYKSLLIVEDDDNFREIICWCLREEGYEVHGARDGAEALRLAREVKPEAIVLDLMMPIMDGWELLDALDADPVLAQIPRFVMTAAPNRNSSDELGAPVFKKPFDVDDLVRAIKEIEDEPDEAFEPDEDEEEERKAAPAVGGPGSFN
jgi:CheY-like chemotaxis protein